MAEWLSRQTRNLIPSGSPGSSPGGVESTFFFFFFSVDLFVLNFFLEGFTYIQNGSCWHNPT